MTTFLIALALVLFAIGFYVLLAGYAIACLVVSFVYHVARFGLVEGKKKVRKIYAHK